MEHSPELLSVSDSLVLASKYIYFVILEKNSRITGHFDRLMLWEHFKVGEGYF